MTGLSPHLPKISAICATALFGLQLLNGCGGGGDGTSGTAPTPSPSAPPPEALVRTETKTIAIPALSSARIIGVGATTAGTDYLVWLGADSGYELDQLFASIRRAGEEWQSPVPLLQSDLLLDSVTVLVNGSDSLLITWLEKLPGDFFYSLRAMELNDGSWTAARTLVSNVDSPISVSVSEKTAVVVWRSSPNRIMGLVKSAAADWSEPTVIAESTTVSLGGARTAMDKQGNILILWREQSETTWKTGGATWNVSDTAWKPIQSSSAAVELLGSHIVSSSDKKFSVLWLTPSMLNAVDIVDGVIGSVAQLSASSLDGSAEGLAVAVTNGSVMAAWGEVAGLAGSLIHAGAYFPASGSWLKVTSLPSYNVLTGTNSPRVATTPSGKALVTWRQGGGSIYAATSGRYADARAYLGTSIVVRDDASLTYAVGEGAGKIYVAWAPSRDAKEVGVAVYQ